MRFATGVGQRKNIRNPPEIAPYSNESEDLRFEYLRQTRFFCALHSRRNEYKHFTLIRLRPS